jgi:hypothetical protein
LTSSRTVSLVFLVIILQATAVEVVGGKSTSLPVGSCKSWGSLSVESYHTLSTELTILSQPSGISSKRALTLQDCSTLGCTLGESLVDCQGIGTVCLSKSIVLVEINIIKAFLKSSCICSIINTCLEDAIVKFSVSNWLIKITARASLYWKIIRVHEEVAATSLLKFNSTCSTFNWIFSPLVHVFSLHTLLLGGCIFRIFFINNLLLEDSFVNLADELGLSLTSVASLEEFQGLWNDDCWLLSCCDVLLLTILTQYCTA